MTHFTDTRLHELLLAQGHEPGFDPPKPRKKRDDEESRNQRQLIKWWAYACRGFGVAEPLLFSVPNGGGRSGPIVGSILKAEGLRKGAPDLFLGVPMKRFRFVPEDARLKRVSYEEIESEYAGLFIEMKTATGHLSPEQEMMLGFLMARGYRCEVCRGWEQARDVITNYLKP